ncbi:MAG: carboxy terminal-processing peptidase, partial [Flavobacteriaceae bacterium]|nr:carboxy terminal-processing peptidase [Flavobacteriaceae bacterium]
KKQGVEGLILDLRNNGGGSLQTVVEMAGLFIESGPIVQVKDAGKRKNVLEDKDKSITWDGPLVIMVNELSASASEILAAAMQDYHRAVIIGSKQTYGKGTVQQVYGLQDILNDASVGDIGALKMTIQKFYRVNGGSTQLEGVKSDIVIPDRYSYIDIGEKDSENPLQWDKIDSANYKPWNKFGDINQIVALSNNRIENNPDIKFLDEQAKYFKSQRDDNQIPLNFDAYIAKINSNKETTNHFKALEDYRSGLTFSSLPYEIQLFEKDSTLLEKRKRWHLSLTKDIYVAESVNVLKDLNEIPSIPSKIAAIKN